jgi:hypothetical protein
MHRFIMNRLWTFILAIGIALAASGAWSAHVRADDGFPLPLDENPLGDVGGDPDRPTTGGKISFKGGPSFGGMSVGDRTVGDGSVSSRMWMLRLRLVVLGLRSFYIRF